MLLELRGRSPASPHLFPAVRYEEDGVEARADRRGILEGGPRVVGVADPAHIGVLVVATWRKRHNFVFERRVDSSGPSV